MNAAATEANTTTVADWEAAETHIAEHTSADAYTLTELTAIHDADLHHIVLDPKTRTIWWAYDNGPLDGEGWTIDQLTPKDAVEMASNQIGIIQDKIDEISAQPEDCGYAQGFGDLDSDQAALDEYAEILRLTLPEDPTKRAATSSSPATRSPSRTPCGSAPTPTWSATWPVLNTAARPVQPVPSASPTCRSAASSAKTPSAGTSSPRRWPKPEKPSPKPPRSVEVRGVRAPTETMQP